MLIYVDPQSYTNHFIKDIALDNLPEECEITSDLARLGDVDIYIAGFGNVDKEMIAEAKNLKSIIRNAVGTDNIDKQAAHDYGVPVYNLPYINYESVAELVMGLMISCARHVVFNHQQLCQGIEHNYHRDYQGKELRGKTFGIIGFGRIGKRLAKMIRSCLSKDVIFYDPFVSDHDGEEAGARKMETVADVLKNADFISIHTPLAEETRNLINKENLALCKKDAIIINTARPGIINEEDLYEALKNHEIYAAADDVMETEIGNKLLQLPNFIGTSHVGGNTEECRRRVGEHLLERLMSEIERIEQLEN